MKKRILLVCNQNPYPCINGGIERLISDYESHVFADFDVYMLFYNPGDAIRMFYYGQTLPGDVEQHQLLTEDWEFVFFFNYDTDFEDDAYIQPVLERFPCFLFTQTHPMPGLNDKKFRGIVSHSSSNRHADVFLPGGFYNSHVFFKNGRTEEFAVCIGRIHEEKNQLELVAAYKERIYDRYQLPLYLVGGVRGGARGLLYFDQVNEFIDNRSILSTVDLQQPRGLRSWLEPSQVAALCNRARLFVMPSPEESFCVALTEAMACGATCVVNGNYSGFQKEALSPHVCGNVTEKQGSILDVIDQVLRDEIRLDASEWVKQFSLQEVKPKLLQFIHKRL
jgi:glycosyltransferase involved in cell wall biosynthesis